MQPVPTVQMLNAFRRHMDSTPRTMGHSELERYNRAYAKLGEQCKARGLTILDLEDFEIFEVAGAKRVRKAGA